MKWTKIQIKTITEAEDAVIAALYGLGLEGAQIEDKLPLTPLEKEQMFVDILPETEEDDGVAYLSFFVERQEEAVEPGAAKETGGGEARAAGGPSLEALLGRIRDELDSLREFMDIGEGSITVSETEDLDWINNWKKYFHQFTIDDILVTPSWEEVGQEDRDKVVVHIDPGTAFGTGMHETTQLCIRQLRKLITPETALLDVGTGSGILAILALLLGAKKAVGTDLDPCAGEASRQNIEANGIRPEAFTLIMGNIITDKEIQDQAGYHCYDIVTANILADVLVSLTPVIPNHLKPGGIYIASGIIDGKEESVAEAVRQAGLEVVEITRQGEWVSVTGRKPRDAGCFGKGQKGC